MNKNNTEMNFTYTYSAKEQDEIKRIRRKYQPPKEDRMARLRKLDAKATKKATTKSLSLGIAGALIMGAGMSLIMTELGIVLGMNDTMSYEQEKMEYEGKTLLAEEAAKFLKGAMHDMKESAKAQHEIDKENFAKVKAETKARHEAAIAQGKKYRKTR